MITKKARQHLFAALAASLGEEDAGALLEMLPPMAWTDLATKHDLDLVRGEINAVEQRLGTKIEIAKVELRSEMIDRFSAIEDRFSSIDSRFSSIDSRFSSIDSRFSSIETHLSKLDSRVNALFPKLVAANISAMIGVAALVLAAAQFA